MHCATQKPRRKLIEKRKKNQYSRSTYSKLIQIIYVHNEYFQFCKIKKYFATVNMSVLTYLSNVGVSISSSHNSIKK